ncbi:ROK family transcriptional regulator [Novosphingobium umbonatum]|nr:ROK family transcriptional regulator [Novosphingobium umbonatum]
MMASQRPSLLLTEPQKRILWQLRIAGPLPRVQLAAALGMNGASMTRLTQHLSAMGLVEELSADEVAARGRPTVPLAVSGHGGWSVGATLHLGWLELVVIDFRGLPLLHDRVPFADPDPRVFARTLDTRLRALAADHGFMRGRFLGLGVAVPGYVLGNDRNRRKVVDWLAPWNDVPLDEVLGDVLSMPVWIENDGTAAALAEYYQPQIVAYHRSVLVLFLGHGVGAGLVAERSLFPGEHGNAGEVGRLFPGNGPRPSGIDLLKTLQQAGVEITSLSEIATVMTAQHALIETWVNRVAIQLELAVFSGVVWLDPGAVVISGALPPAILQSLAARIEALSAARGQTYLAAQPRIYASSMGSAAVVIGAALAPVHAITALRGENG